MIDNASSGSRGPVSSRNSMWLMVLAVALSIVIPRLLMLQLSVMGWNEASTRSSASNGSPATFPIRLPWRSKPIGLYGIFAFFFLALGDDIWVIRLSSIVFVAGTAVLLARLAQRHFGNGHRFGALTAALYGFLTLANGGLATNTEILVNFFIVLAVCLLTGGSLDQKVWISEEPDCRREPRRGVQRQLSRRISNPRRCRVLSLLAGALANGGRVVAIRYVANGVCMFLGFLLVTLALLLPVLIAGDIRTTFAATCLSAQLRRRSRFRNRAPPHSRDGKRLLACFCRGCAASGFRTLAAMVVTVNLGIHGISARQAYPRLACTAAFLAACGSRLRERLPAFFPADRACHGHAGSRIPGARLHEPAPPQFLRVVASSDERSRHHSGPRRALARLSISPRDLQGGGSRFGGSRRRLHVGAPETRRNRSTSTADSQFSIF